MSSDESRSSTFTPRVAADVGDDNTHPQSTRSAAAWRPRDESKCLGCGGHVTPQFRKSLGDDDDVAHACPSCVDASDLQNGAAADPEFEKRVQPENESNLRVEEQIREIGGGASR